MPAKYIPVCDFCTKPAIYDGKTKGGPWAYMCERHFKSTGINQPGFFTVLHTDTEEKPHKTRIEK